MNFRGSSGKNSMRVGPWGGLGGDPWDDGINSGVRQIIISHGAAIYSKQFEYDLRGSLVWSEKHGTSGGSSKTDQVKLNYPEEVLTSISGCYGALGASVVIRSLTFESNCSKYGPFGTEQGTSFSLPVFTGKIVGFHGRSGTCLHSIGCHLNKENTTKLSKNAPTIIRSYDRNGHRYADSSAGYDMILAVKDRGDNYNVLASSVPKEQYPNNPSNMSKMVSIPSFHSDNGTMTISTPVRFGPWWKQWYHI